MINKYKGYLLKAAVIIYSFLDHVVHASRKYASGGSVYVVPSYLSEFDLPAIQSIIMNVFCTFDIPYKYQSTQYLHILCYDHTKSVFLK